MVAGFCMCKGIGYAQKRVYPMRKKEYTLCAKKSIPYAQKRVDIISKRIINSIITLISKPFLRFEIFFK